MPLQLQYIHCRKELAELVHNHVEKEIMFLNRLYNVSSTGRREIF